MFCTRHIVSNFLRRFKTPYLHKLVVNIGYSRTEKEYNKNDQRLKERVVNRFDRCNEMFEVYEMHDGSIYTINLAQQLCDSGHFQVERLPCCHVLACCTNQRLDEFIPMGDPYLRGLDMMVQRSLSTEH
ncbi:hypothetical protein Ahy_B06g084368 [Arachis hypogaea]|uniref:SWIM-type domain-containing protein n=1 Tax=Arachis hypogaea TaxID=3818 RepID=A0A444YRR0_ARAHY|nr:hypothetical protein Ahy_B06g084368 [Arachis hypogaea]